MTMRPIRREQALAGCIVAAVAICATAGAAQAQAQDPGAPQWQFYLTPYLWVAGISGTLQTPNPRVPAQDVSAGFGDMFAHLDAIPIMGAAEVRFGRFGLLTDVMAISVKADVSANRRLFSGGSVRLTQVIGSAVATYRLVDLPDQSLDAGIGVRAIGVSTKFTMNAGLLPGFTRTPGASWADPIFAARYHVDLGLHWGLTAYGDVGGGPSSQLTWQLLGTVDYRLRDSVVMRLGYRHLNFQYHSDVLRQNVSMSGPILGATIRF